MAITLEHMGMLVCDECLRDDGTFDKEKFERLLPGVLLPDMARSLFIGAEAAGPQGNDSPNPEKYGMTRKALHFEEAQDGSDVSWIRYPSDYGAYTPGRILDGLEFHMAEGQKPCAIGELTQMDSFVDHNKDLRAENPDLYEGIGIHLAYDRAHDTTFRSLLDERGANRLYGTYQRNGKTMDGAAVRKFASSLSQDGFLYLYKRTFLLSHGTVRLDNDFVENVVKPALYRVFDHDFADSGLRYMTVSEETLERCRMSEDRTTLEGLFQTEGVSESVFLNRENWYSEEQEQLCQLVQEEELER